MKINGTIAFLRGGAAFVGTAAGGRGDIRLPQKMPTQLGLSPGNNPRLLLFSAKEPGVLFLPPYTQAKSLPEPLAGRVPERIVWSAPDATAFCSGDGFCGVLDSDDRWTGLPFPSVHSVSASGERAAWATDRMIQIGSPDNGRVRTVLSTGRPEPLAAALRAARFPEKVRDLAELDHTLWKSVSNWQISPPALTPDGKTLFFASNIGQGMGAAGNTTFCWFAMDIGSGKIQVLSKLGTFFGRVPGDGAVSPDGKRLLFSVSQHNMAVDNPSFVYVVDLPTQQSRELIHNDPRHKNDSNLLNGICWSPDSRFVAVSGLYYNVAALLRKENGEPNPDDYRLRIFDIASGRIIREIPGATRPSWGG